MEWLGYIIAVLMIGYFIRREFQKPKKAKRASAPKKAAAKKKPPKTKKKTGR